MQIMARWQRLGPGDPPGASRGAVSWWDSDSVPFPTMDKVLLQKALLRASCQLLRSSRQPGGAGAAHELLLGASHGLQGASSTCRVQGW